MDRFHPTHIMLYLIHTTLTKLLTYPLYMINDKVFVLSEILSTETDTGYPIHLGDTDTPEKMRIRTASSE